MSQSQAVPADADSREAKRKRWAKVQGRRWCFTFYTEEDVARLREEPLDALVIAREEGTEAKHTHYQGYCKFTSNRRGSWWFDRFHRSSSAEGGDSRERSAHWELAKGPEWTCRRYIVDVAAYLRDNPDAHAKEQGEVIVDFGCEVHVPHEDDVTVHVIKMLVEGARLSQVFRAHPRFFFHNCRKINDMQAHIKAWHEAGEEYRPERYESPPRKRYKKSEDDAGAAD